MDKLWVIGKTGMLGSAFCCAFDRQNIPYIATSKAEVSILDFAKVEEFCKKNKITAIINCAGYTHVDLAENEEAKAFALNAKAPEFLARLTKKLGIKFLHFSTDYVFDGEKNAPYKEDDIVNPLSVYGKSKAEGEQNILKENPDSCIIRTSWLFGLKGKNFVKSLLFLLKTKKELKIVNDQIGCPTFADDLVLVSIALFNQKGIFHVTNQGEVSWYGFAVQIAELAKELKLPVITESILQISSADYKVAAKRPAYSVLSNQKAQNVTKITLPFWQEALAACLLALHPEVMVGIS